MYDLESTILKRYRMKLEGGANEKESTRGDHGVESGDQGAGTVGLGVGLRLRVGGGGACS
jgi:hypothetical protein